MVGPDSITEQDIRQVYTLLNGIGSEFVGGFDVNKIIIQQNCEGDTLAFISTEDAYNDDGTLKPDSKPDAMTICLDSVRTGVKGSLDSWKGDWPNMIDTYEGSSSDPNFLKSAIGVILALILADAAAHEDRHRQSPPDIDSNTGAKIPTLSDEASAESAGHATGDRLSDRLYKDIDYKYLNPSGNQISSVKDNYASTASLSSSISMIKNVPSINKDFVSELEELFSSEISKKISSGSVRRQD